LIHYCLIKILRRRGHIWFRVRNSRVRVRVRVRARVRDSRGGALGCFCFGLCHPPRLVEFGKIGLCDLGSALALQDLVYVTGSGEQGLHIQACLDVETVEHIHHIFGCHVA
jgi:hypothetical protein